MQDQEEEVPTLRRYLSTFNVAKYPITFRKLYQYLGGEEVAQ